MGSESVEKKALLVRSLLIAGGLMGFKLGVFAITNSMAILASAADSLMDFLVSLANFLLIMPASKPADHNPPYGHGKIESLAGMVQSLILGGAAFSIGAMAVKRFLAPEEIYRPEVGILVTVVAIALNLWHSRNLRRSMIKTNSPMMAAEYLHYASDTLVYLGVLVSFSLFKITGKVYWDPLISLLIVGYLLKAVVSLFLDTLTELLDVQLPELTLKEIDVTIRAFHPAIVGYHDLRTRKVGTTKFIEFHVVLRGVETFRDVHKLTVGLMETFQKIYPGAIVTVHADPETAPH